MISPLYHSRPERWPQVSLRGLFVLVAVLGVFLAWFGAQLKWVHERHQFRRTHASIPMNPLPPAFAPQVLRILGEAGIATIYTERLNENEIADAKRLFSEADIVAADPWRNLQSQAGKRSPP